MPTKDIRYSVLDLAPVMAGGNFKQSFENSLSLALHTEKLGYTRFWLAEHHNMAHIGSSAPAVLIGYIADATTKIRVGSGGVMLPNHSSLIIAEQFGTLATLYPNRIDLGVGRAPGTDKVTADALGRNAFTINEQFPRQVEELRTYFSYDNHTSKVRAFPSEGLNVPIYMLGSSTDSAWLAAAKGLPYAFAAHFAPDQMEAAFKIYQENFVPSETCERPYKIVTLNVIAADTDAEAAYLATTLFQSFLNLIRDDRKPFQPPVKDMDAIWSPAEASYVQRMLSHTLIGSKTTIQKKISALKGVYEFDELMAISYVYDFQKRLQVYDILQSAIVD